ncbi:MAG: hypothetical protein COT81_04115 [Candidatus Buchananbacteria bacterium CG10_big_fil_rev_8_21_14_0_10_42_9]|uniref:Uncharacterized protein n=1 Tax=Candidatus Buchananbacteria bacterium CG10_big_fil_rev_8_21_14_0_10_42_9 TaxID=1974526 RepID=A0A2H0W2N1_9BACT|nr:MAG: hypothetical protein COT81_04115 [Candidatus Buchananbacteria bacterium CG10_big_fil_rev_8_21_14_0_10_42_9]
MKTMSSQLDNQVVIITGAAKGLGRALALGLAKEGAIVVGHYHKSKKEAGELEKELREFNDKSRISKADLISAKETEAMFKNIFKQFGKVDILINNVGNFIYTPIEETTIEQFDDVWQTNARSTFLCSQLVLPEMKAQGSGKIINFGCVGADRMVLRENTTPYYIAKSAVIQLTKKMAESYAPHGININAISPGILDSSEHKLDVPAGRYANFDDILNAVLFLLSNKSNYINGANIEVAGGWAP